MLAECRMLWDVMQVTHPLAAISQAYRMRSLRIEVDPGLPVADLPD
jgi:hypothetical protein